MRGLGPGALFARFLGCCALRLPCEVLFLPEPDLSQDGEHHDADDAEHVVPTGTVFLLPRTLGVTDPAAHWT
jgi:hypothetical protein